jgi:hypothetical protein
MDSIYSKEKKRKEKKRNNNSQAPVGEGLTDDSQGQT